MYVRDAVEGALNQSYSPLEIILSDDFSSDKTYEIIKELTAEYVGPHKIILNRNAKNLGLVKHLNRVIKLCRGEWIVKGDGDDISLPNRVEEISKIIERQNVFGIGTASQIIDQNGHSIGIQCQNETIFGSNSAWHKKCFENFDDLPGELGCEDNVLFFRSLLLGGVAFTNNVTVKYRMFDSISNKNYSNLSDYYVHKFKINKLIAYTLKVRIDELMKFELELSTKQEIRKILEQKLNYINNKNILVNSFLELQKKPLIAKIKYLFVDHFSKRFSFKENLKLFFLTNSFFAFVYTTFFPGWLKISFRDNHVIINTNDLIIKTLDDYSKETDIRNHW